MQNDPTLLAEAQRQFLICSACRYCEGYCATFPAIEGRTQYAAADVAYTANLCHDCRACSQACMYSPPHEFAVDIPRLLGAARLASYGRRSGSRFTGLSVCVTLALLLGALALSGRWNAFVTEHAGAGAFYAVVPFAWMLVPALLLALWALWALTHAARRFARDVAPGERLTPSAWLGAVHDGVNLVYMSGGGDGCYYPGQRDPSVWRRVFHMTLVAGVASAFAATISAAVLQDVLGRLPPYPLVSAPVLLGIGGGIAILVGAAGLLALKAIPQARRGAAEGMTPLDVVFLVLLLVVAATGLLLLAFRETASMGALLVLHLAAVAGLFMTAPYGKLIHVPLRLAALAVFRTEEASAPSSR